MPTTETVDTTSKPPIRLAIPADVRVIAQIVDDAYRHYIPRIGRPPQPMLDDHATRVSDGVVWVIEEDGTIWGVVMLLPEPDHLLVDNIAVVPSRQRTARRQLWWPLDDNYIGRLGFAEAEVINVPPAIAGGTLNVRQAGH